MTYILKYITVTTITNSDFIVEGMVYTSAGGDSVKNICTVSVDIVLEWV